jgi:hypothetical protein
MIKGQLSPVRRPRQAWRKSLRRDRMMSRGQARGIKAETLGGSGGLARVDEQVAAVGELGE